MNPDFSNSVLLVVYLIVGTVGIAFFAGWALKRFGPPKK
jgi:ABC-type glycerol-3-phosphate transport system permease component